MNNVTLTAHRNRSNSEYCRKSSKEFKTAEEEIQVSLVTCLIYRSIATAIFEGILLSSHIASHIAPIMPRLDGWVTSSLSIRKPRLKRIFTIKYKGLILWEHSNKGSIQREIIWTILRNFG